MLVIIIYISKDDVLPTICDYAGIKIPEHLLGRSLKQVAEGGQDNARRPFIVAEHDNARMLRTDRYKYCIYKDGKNRESLVDLFKDPGEMHNRAFNPEYLEILKKHRSHLQGWIKESNDEDAKSFAIP